MSVTATRSPADEPEAGDVWTHGKLVLTVSGIPGDMNTWPGRMVHYSVTADGDLLYSGVKRINTWYHRIAGFRFVRNDPLGDWIGWEL